MIIYMINNFSVNQDKIDELERIISDITDSTVKFQKGFIESNLLKNLDSNLLTMGSVMPTTLLLPVTAGTRLIKSYLSSKHSLQNVGWSFLKQRPGLPMSLKVSIFSART